MCCRDPCAPSKEHDTKVVQLIGEAAQDATMVRKNVECGRGCETD